MNRGPMRRPLGLGRSSSRREAPQPLRNARCRFFRGIFIACNPYQVVRFAVCAAISGAIALDADAQLGTIRIGNVQQTGDLVTFPVALEGDLGAGISAMDFRILYDEGVFEPVAVHAGSAVTSAGKQIHANILRDGEYVVLMTGLNRASILGGDVASVTMRVLDAPESGVSMIQLANTSLSDSDAVGVPSQGSSATIAIRNPGDEDTGKPGKGETPDSPGSGPGPSLDGGLDIGTALPPVDPDADFLPPSAEAGQSGKPSGSSNAMNTLSEQLEALDRLRADVQFGGTGVPSADSVDEAELTGLVPESVGEEAYAPASMVGGNGLATPQGMLAPEMPRADAADRGAIAPGRSRSMGILIPASIGCAILALVLSFRGVLFRS